MYGYIYKTTDLTNGLIYVGQKHSDHFIPEYLGSGTNIKAAVQQKGKDKFVAEMLEAIDDVEMMDERERFWIAKLNSRDPEVGYNLMPGGAVERRLAGPLNPFYGQHHTEEVKKKLALSSSNYSRPHTQEEKEKLSIAMTGRTITWGHKISENAKVNPNYGMKGKHMTEEAKQQISEYHKVRFEDPNAREHMSKLTKSAWDDPEYRRKHIEGMKGKKRSHVPKTECPVCGKLIVNSNLSRHIAAYNK